MKGWYTLGYTLAQEKSRSRGERFQDCLAAASSSRVDAYVPPSGNRVMVFTNVGIDEWGNDFRAYIGTAVSYAASAHEMAHALGMQHSFSDDTSFRPRYGRNLASTTIPGIS